MEQALLWLLIVSGPEFNEEFFVVAGRLPEAECYRKSTEINLERLDETRYPSVLSTCTKDRAFPEGDDDPFLEQRER